MGNLTVVAQLVCVPPEFSEGDKLDGRQSRSVLNMKVLKMHHFLFPEEPDAV